MQDDNPSNEKNEVSNLLQKIFFVVVRKYIDI